MNVTIPKFRLFNRLIISGFTFVILSQLVINFIVDPFNKNQMINLDLPKSKISYRMNYHLYKLLEYSRNPQPIIILGDSRADELHESLFQEAGVSNVYNFSYGGGTLFEVVDTFWFAAKQIKLQKIIIGVPFNLYSESNNLNRFPEANEVSQNFFLYYFSPLVTKASLFNVLTYITGKEYKSEKPPMSREQFWEYQLGHITDLFYSNWRKPNILHENLLAIANYCRKNNIEINFFLPPTHVDLQNKVIEFELYDQYESYKKDIQQLGTVFDFDFHNDVTKDKNNFKDPYHFNLIIARKIVQEMVGYSQSDTSFCRIY